jgi:electron transfer flavoprotein beta subunit
MKAKKKEIKSVKIADLGLDPNAVGKAGAKTQILKMYSPPQRESGKIIEGETAEETASKLAKLLREEAKVI